MNEAKFVHLRNHTQYSLSSGTIKIFNKVKKGKEEKKEHPLFDKCKQYSMPACAITDTGNMFGTLEFSSYGKEVGIQPLIGCELSLRANKYFNKIGDSINEEDNFSKIILLAQNQEGLYNLFSIDSDNFLKRGELSSHIEIEWLKEQSKGIICLTGGFEGLIGKLLLKKEKGQAEEALLELKNIFEDRLYMEITRHGLSKELQTEQDLLDLAYKHNIPLVATNDCYFLEKDMYEAQNILSCIEGKKELTQLKGDTLENNDKIINEEFYFKSQEEMIDLFKDIPEAIENTINIAKRISICVNERKPTLPHYPIVNNLTIEEKENILKPLFPNYDLINGILKEKNSEKEIKISLDESIEMIKIAYEGFHKHMERKFILENITDEKKKEEIIKKYEEQMKYELSVIIEMDFPGYFLIVADFINWSKEHDIPVGPGRGSGAGSVVAWVMGITELDPINFNLIFERFLNPERVSMPDFDVDFCQRDRDKTIQYVQRKYGIDMVAQIVTFGNLKTRKIIQDVGRILGMSFTEVQKITKKLDRVKSIEENLEENKDLNRQVLLKPNIRELFVRSMQLENLSRNSSLHAAGVVIGDKPIRKICPLYFPDNKKTEKKEELNEDEEEVLIQNKEDEKKELFLMPAVQYTTSCVEKTGLVKFDFLGLKTLTIMKDAIAFIKYNRNIDVDLNNIKLDIAEIYANTYAAGDTIGIFQFESDGMRSYLKQGNPTNIEDIIAFNALYRPGPMDQIPIYIKRKKGEEEIKYLHPILENILKNTYGVIIYQEQVMQIARDLAGYSLGGADILRRAMGKKKMDVMIEQKAIFIKKAKEINNVDESVSNEIFDLLMKFAEYGFNRSHAAAYSLISYQTAYLKYYFPVEFMTANMNMDINDDKQIAKYIDDLYAHDIQIYRPDVNNSDVLFSVVKEKVNKQTSKNKNKYIDGYELKIRYGLTGIKGIGENVANAIIQERNKNGKFKDLFDFVSRIDINYMNKKTIEALAKSGALDCLYKNRKEIFENSKLLSDFSKQYSENRKNTQFTFFENIDTSIQPTLKSVGKDWSDSNRSIKEFEAYGFFFLGHPLQNIIKTLEARNFTSLKQIYDDNIEDNKEEEDEENITEEEGEEKHFKEEKEVNDEKVENHDKIWIAGIVISSSIKIGNKNSKYLKLKISDITKEYTFNIYENNKNKIDINSPEFLDLVNEEKHNKLAIQCHVIVNEENGVATIRLNALEIVQLEKYLNSNRQHKKIVKSKNSNEDREIIVIETKVIKSLEISINDSFSLMSVKEILDSSKTTEDRFTNIILNINEYGVSQKIQLPNSYILTDTIELKHLKNINNIQISNIEYF